MPEAVIIGQDEATEIRVQALIQSGRRRVDIRVWRRGPSGFAPSRSGLTLNVADLDALSAGIVALLRASRGGTDVAHVVGDDDTRRLHAEIAPFGAHHVARFGFWQRVRNTWRAADDGLTVSSVQLPALRQALPRFRPWLAFPRGEGQPDTSGREGAGRWPPPGADWLTVEPASIALHPRGIRITATLIGDGANLQVAIRQWQRDERLWVPRDQAMKLPVSAMEPLLTALEALEQNSKHEAIGRRQMELGETAIWLRSSEHGELTLERREQAEDGVETILVLPAEHLPRFGRFLLESWSLLVDRLSAEALMEPDVALIVADALPEVSPTDPPSHVDEGAPATGAGLAADTRHEEVTPKPTPPVPLGTATVSEHHLVFSHLDAIPEAMFFVQWEERSIEIPTRCCADIVAGVRTLYYDALVGHRHMLVHEEVGMRVAVHNQGTRLCLVLEQGREGDVAALTIPGSEVPTFLNAVEAALSHL